MKNVRAAVCLAALLLPFACAPAVAAEAESTLSWEPPTTRVDGTPMALEEIKEYRAFYTVDGQPAKGGEFFVIGPGATGEQITLELTPRAEPYVVSFAILTVDTNGLESVMSDTVSKQFDVDSTAEPSAVTNLRFTVSCITDCTIEEVPAK